MGVHNTLGPEFTRRNQFRLDFYAKFSTTRLYYSSLFIINDNILIVRLAVAKYTHSRGLRGAIHSGRVILYVFFNDRPLCNVCRRRLGLNRLCCLQVENEYHTILFRFSSLCSRPG